MRITPLLLIAALAASLPAHAVDSYVGFGLTQAPSEQRLVISPGVSARTETDPYTRIYAGVYIDQNFSIEGAYHYFGTTKCCNGISDAGFDIDTKAWSIGVRYEYGDAQWAPYSKLGYFASDSDGHELTISGPVAFSDSDNGLMFEGGVRWMPNDTFSLRGGYEWFDSERGGDGGITVAAEFSF